MYLNPALPWYGWFIWEFPEQSIEIVLKQIDCTSSHVPDRPWEGIEELRAWYSYAGVSDSFDFSRCSWRDNWYVAKPAMPDMPWWFDELASELDVFGANPSSIFQIYILCLYTFLFYAVESTVVTSVTVPSSSWRHPMDFSQEASLCEVADKISLKIQNIYHIQTLRALIFKSSYVFLNPVPPELIYNNMHVHKLTIYCGPIYKSILYGWQRWQ